MLGNLKKKLSDVIQEGLILSEGLSQHYLRSYPNSPSKSNIDDDDFLNPAELGIPPEINLTAGCSLLSKYEDDWKKIHEVNEENGEKAAFIAEQIDQIESRMARQQVTMTDLKSCLATIPTLTEKLRASIEVLNNVQRLCDSAEDKIIELQNICEECELQEEMLEKKFELSQHKQKKMAELEIFRQKLAAEHQAKIHLHEMKLRQIQKERQAVFDDAFRCDLEEFKQKGSLQKIEHREANNTNELALEEVDLDDTDTKDALEEFLNG